MILNALVKYYEDLVRKGEAELPGWSFIDVSFALEIDGDGNLLQAYSLKTEVTKGKKTILKPQELALPTPVKRSSGIRANFLCDNSVYVLGIPNVVDKKKDNESIDDYNERLASAKIKSKDRFEACRELHKNLLSNINTDASIALMNFFEKWNPEEAEENEALSDVLQELQKGGNIVFRYNGCYLHEYDEIRKAWQKNNEISDVEEKEICLVTGNKDVPELLHPSIKGIRDAQSSGASLVSFNSPAFCSFNKQQGLNAQTGKYAAFAYGTGLNILVKDKEHNNYVGDTLVLYWASGGEHEYQNLFEMEFFGTETGYSDSDLREMLNDICKGNSVIFNERLLEPDKEFYILGISPNAARLSVRFFIKNSFGQILRNINEHQERLEIERPSFDKFSFLPIWKLVDETINKKSRDKKSSPNLTGELLRSILNNTNYPSTLLNGVELRIHAEHDITRGRAAIIKAYYLKNINKDVPKEVLTVSLNTETKNPAYVLGRLFSILEDIQQKANPGINATIKDKYFNSASATPAAIFPLLINLTQKHLKKLDIGMKIYYDKQLGEIFTLLENNYPGRFNLPQQGAFQIGYYHQTQARYQKKNSQEETK